MGRYTAPSAVDMESQFRAKTTMGRYTAPSAVDMESQYVHWVPSHSVRAPAASAPASPAGFSLEARGGKVSDMKRAQLGLELPLSSSMKRPAVITRTPLSPAAFGRRGGASPRYMPASVPPSVDWTTMIASSKLAGASTAVAPEAAAKGEGPLPSPAAASPRSPASPTSPAAEAGLPRAQSSPSLQLRRQQIDALTAPFAAELALLTSGRTLGLGEHLKRIESGLAPHPRALAQGVPPKPVPNLKQKRMQYGRVYVHRWKELQESRQSSAPKTADPLVLGSPLDIERFLNAEQGLAPSSQSRAQMDSGCCSHGLSLVLPNHFGGAARSGLTSTTSSRPGTPGNAFPDWLPGGGGSGYHAAVGALGMALGMPESRDGLVERALCSGSAIERPAWVQRQLEAARENAAIWGLSRANTPVAAAVRSRASTPALLDQPASANPPRGGLAGGAGGGAAAAAAAARGGARRGSHALRTSSSMGDLQPSAQSMLSVQSVQSVQSQPDTDRLPPARPNTPGSPKRVPDERGNQQAISSDQAGSPLSGVATAGLAPPWDAPREGNALGNAPRPSTVPAAIGTGLPQPLPPGYETTLPATQVERMVALRQTQRQRATSHDVVMPRAPSLADMAASMDHAMMAAAPGAAGLTPLDLLRAGSGGWI